MNLFCVELEGVLEHFSYNKQSKNSHNLVEMLWASLFSYTPKMS